MAANPAAEAPKKVSSRGVNLRGDTLPECKAILQRYGRVEIPCPHGHGLYVVKIKGSKWYDTPEVGFYPNENCPVEYGQDFLRQYASMYSSTHGTTPGRVIPIAGIVWGSSWQYPDGYRKMAMQLVRLIISGSKLYKMTCGDIMSSRNAFLD